MIIIDRPKKLYVFLGRTSLLASVIFIWFAFQNETRLNQESLIGFGCMCLITGLLGGFLQTNYKFDKTSVTKELFLLMKIKTEVVALNNFSSITLRESETKSQGADLSREANTSISTHYYALSLDRTATSRGKRLEIKKFFKKSEAEKAALDIANTTGLKVNKHYR